MKLHRFNSDNDKYDYKKNNINESVSINSEDEIEKFKIIYEIASHWNEKLNIDFKIPKSLEKYSINELKNIYKKYVLTDNKEHIEEKHDDSIKTVDNRITSLEELREQYLEHEAVLDIRLESDHIVFDVECETEIHSCEDYNGIPLKYNRICDIKPTIKEFNNEINLSEDLISLMKERYENFVNDDKLCFLDNGIHFATLISNNVFHDGTLNEDGWRSSLDEKVKNFINENNIDVVSDIKEFLLYTDDCKILNNFKNDNYNDVKYILETNYRDEYQEAKKLAFYNEDEEIIIKEHFKMYENFFNNLNK